MLLQRKWVQIMEGTDYHIKEIGVYNLGNSMPPAFLKLRLVTGTIF